MAGTTSGGPDRLNWDDLPRARVAPKMGDVLQGWRVMAVGNGSWKAWNFGRRSGGGAAEERAAGTAKVLTLCSRVLN